MGSFPNGLPLGMFGWSKYKILPVYGEKRPIYVHSYLDTKIYTFIYTENALKRTLSLLWISFGKRLDH